MSALSLERVSRAFGSATALREVSASIGGGEFFSIVGPSGCGKTTLLRVIAGFERPDSGRVLIDGADVTARAPGERSVGMVFQNYALFPHMDVYRNVAFGLEARKVSSEEIQKKVATILASVQLGHKERAAVTSLSGGEQQRVAVARAMVTEPSILLFDEPLSNLDVSLRASTRQEIRAVQRAAGVTAVYVTHDQAEAMALSDRIAVMRGGAFEQVGTPAEVFERPATPFVAEFLGGATLLPASMHDGGIVIGVGESRIVSPRGTFPFPDGDVIAAIRPDAVQPDVAAAGSPRAVVEEKEFLGVLSTLSLRAGSIVIRSIVHTTTAVRSLPAGAEVGMIVDWHRCHIFPRSGV